MNIMDKLSLAGLVPVIKVEDAQDAVPLCKALKDGGLPVAEITFRTAAAEEAIKNVHEALPDVMLGAGTVLTVDQVKRAVNAGAAYIVSPGLNPTVVGYCVENNIPILPGCANPSDIEMALSFGLDTVKFFPAEAAGGINFIKAISAPYGNMKFVPTGGISEKNLMDYLSFNKVRAAGGSWMVPGDAVKNKDWDKITQLTKQAVKVMLGLELKHIGINSASPEKAMKDAEAFCFLTGLAIKDGNSSVFAGTAIEAMKAPYL
ncbi:MAG: bifunctional 4-hydroxy-2-oxoglutarate aldolase/2-dehydro-3-deoxy-phosphogluconate aldolase, partial [Clostridia bacterium]|nr:bifunctional 4-hydroxy-2-oxoglutarate aldolase/2-dehydro-3-deoxy-phosphogluconate aldolase [Clostridia bacterium]